MNPTRRTGGRRARRAAAAALATVVALVGAVVLSGFHVPVERPAGGTSGEVAGGALVGIRTFAAPAGLRIDEDVEYRTTDDGTLLTADVCRPAIDAVEPRAAVVSVHGGSWRRGAKDNADWRAVCEWLADEGFVAVSIDYRLVPDAVFPSQLDDVRAAIRWLREPGQSERWGYDPARIGLFGGSAGGQLAALAGLVGQGATDQDDRVAAVVELSGPVGLSEPELLSDGATDWLQGIVADYLACDEADDCRERRAEASPATHADATDPAVLVLHGDAELIPLGQSLRFVAQLRAAGVDARMQTIAAAEHSIGLLDATERRVVAAFLHERLDPRTPVRPPAAIGATAVASR